MLDQEKVIKLEICTLKSEVLLTVTGNYSFPRRLIEEPDSKDERSVMMVKGKDLPVFARGAFLNIVVYMRAGDRINYPAVVEVSTETQLNIMIRFDRAKVLQERRRYFKIDTDERCGLFAITRGEKNIVLDVPIPGRIQNINLGGVFLCLLHPVDLIVGDSVNIIIPELVGERIELVLKILRIQKGQEGEVIGYGCCFLFLSSKQEELLSKYITKLQIAKRALERSQEKVL